MALSGDHVRYLYDFWHTEKGRIAIKEFKTVAWPDEIYFQTILLNSKYKNNVINKMLWYVDWRKGPWLPRVLDMTDLDLLKKSNELFARKFDIPGSDELLNTLSINNENNH